MKDKCPKCGETENLHFNYDYSKQHRPVEGILCNQCGENFNPSFDPTRPLGEILKEINKQKSETGRYEPPYVSDDFQIGPDGAYEHTEEFETKPGFVERRMALGKAQNNKDWDKIYSEYSDDQYPPFGGPFTDALSFIDWLKENYISPVRI